MSSIRFAHFVHAILLTIIALCGYGGAPSAYAAQSFANCTGFIDVLPTTITTQGTWCMRMDLNTAITSGNAVTIATNNVTIDCNDFKLGGLSAGLGTLASGIAALDKQNNTVRRCNIRGFWLGVNFAASDVTLGGHAVEDNRLDGNTGIGIVVRGNASVVRRNRVSNTGNSTVPNIDGMGILTQGSVDVIDNTVAGVNQISYPSFVIAGIFSWLNPNGQVLGNRVRGLVSNNGGSNIYGILASQSTRVTIRDNDVIAATTAGGLGLGLFCADNTSLAIGNVISGFGTGINACQSNANTVLQ